jgi:ribokinase
VVVLGDVRADLIVRTRRLPVAGETLEGDLFVQEPGGKGARQAIAAARLGARVALVARIGADPHGDEILTRLRVEGVRTEHVARDREARTAFGLVHLDRRGRRSTAAFSAGANARISLEDVRAADDVIKHAFVLVASLEASPACIAEAFRIARRHVTQIVLDADPGQKAPDRLLRLVDVAIVTARNARLLTGASVTGRRSALNAARALLRRGVGALALRTSPTTLLLTRNDEIWVPNPSGKRTDTSEAGDAFCSAVAVALAEDLDLARAGRLAAAAAVLSTPRRGEPPPLPTRAEVNGFANESPRAEELTLDGVLPSDAPEAPAHPPA